MGANQQKETIMNDSATRLDLISQIEKERKSKVLTYFCGDRPISPANISTDAIRPLYDHLLALTSDGEKGLERLDLFLYSIGGRLEAPWRIVTMLREFCGQLSVIIPYKAHSAATLIALGADKVVMGRKGELSPIDPSLHVVVPEGAPTLLPPEIGVEDISSYLSFVKERGGLSDQQALSQAISILAEKLTPPLLGQIHRAYSHIRLVARKLLSLCQPPLDDRRVTAIVEALTEKIYLHGHGIARKEAEEIGLQIEKPNPQLERMIWDLYTAYEELLKLNTSADTLGYFTSEDVDEYKEPRTVIACIESTEKFHMFSGDLVMRRVRKIPAQPTININLGLQLPAGLQPETIPQQLQQAMQQMLQQAAGNLKDLVRKEIVRQSPVEKVERRITGGNWQELVRGHEKSN
jgi:hypothetical protein